MYNGQFIKAFAHVMIFVVLIVAVKHVSGILGILIPFFIFYMAFEAYKTAEANLRGLPGPDPLGLDRLLGVQENQPVTSMGGTAASAQAASGTPVPAQPVPKESTPTAAFILIALGIFFLLGNLDWIHSDRLWPLLLIGLGLWIAYKRTAGHA
jgi:cadmium resistance protein CadD (predicted permease)